MTTPKDVPEEVRAFCDTALSMKVITPEQADGFYEQWTSGFKVADSYFLLHSILTPGQIDKVRDALPEELAGRESPLLNDDDSVLMMLSSEERAHLCEDKDAIVLDVSTATPDPEDDSWILDPNDPATSLPGPAPVVPDAASAPKAASPAPASAAATGGGNGWIFGVVALVGVLGVAAYGFVQVGRMDGEVQKLRDQLAGQSTSLGTAGEQLEKLAKRLDETEMHANELTVRADAMENQLLARTKAADGMAKRIDRLEELGARQEKLAKEIQGQLAEMKTSIAGGAAGQDKLAKALEATSRKLDALGVTLDEADRKIDTLAKAARTSESRIGDLGKAVTRVDDRLGKLEPTAGQRASLDRMARWMSARAADLHRSALAASARGEHEAALEEVTLAVRLDSTRADSLVLRSETLSRLGRHDEAVADARAAIKLEATGPASFALGLGLAGLGKHADALAAFDEADKLGVDEIRVLEQKVKLLEKMGNVPEAARVRKRLAELKGQTRSSR